MIVTCPYCHKKMHVSPRQIILKGRLSVACPGCRRQVYRALQKQPLAVQFLMVVAALAVFAGLSQVNIPGGALGSAAALAAGTAAVLAQTQLPAPARSSMVSKIVPSRSKITVRYIGHLTFDLI